MLGLNPVDEFLVSRFMTNDENREEVYRVAAADFVLTGVMDTHEIDSLSQFIFYPKPYEMIGYKDLLSLPDVPVTTVIRALEILRGCNNIYEVDLLAAFVQFDGLHGLIPKMNDSDSETRVDVFEIFIHAVKTCDLAIPNLIKTDFLGVLGSKVLAGDKVPEMQDAWNYLLLTFFSRIKELYGVVIRLGNRLTDSLNRMNSSGTEQLSSEISALLSEFGGGPQPNMDLDEVVRARLCNVSLLKEIVPVDIYDIKPWIKRVEKLGVDALLTDHSSAASFFHLVAFETAETDELKGKICYDWAVMLTYKNDFKQALAVATIGGNLKNEMCCIMVPGIMLSGKVPGYENCEATCVEMLRGMGKSNPERIIGKLKKIHSD
jgi:hypothetical protein